MVDPVRWHPYLGSALAHPFRGAVSRVGASIPLRVGRSLPWGRQLRHGTAGPGIRRAARLGDEEGAMLASSDTIIRRFCGIGKGNQSARSARLTSRGRVGALRSLFFAIRRMVYKNNEVWCTMFLTVFTVRAKRKRLIETLIEWQDGTTTRQSDKRITV